MLGNPFLVCANVAYRRQQRHREILLDVLLDERATVRYGISARNPSPFCIPIMLGIPMSMCVQLSNIAVIGNNLNICMDFMVNMGTAQLLQMHFQCMMVGAQGLQWVDTEGQSVIPGQRMRPHKTHITSPPRFSKSSDEQMMDGVEIDDDAAVSNSNIQEIQLIRLGDEMEQNLADVENETTSRNIVFQYKTNVEKM